MANVKLSLKTTHLSINNMCCVENDVAGNNPRIVSEGYKARNR